MFKCIPVCAECKTAGECGQRSPAVLVPVPKPRRKGPYRAVKPIGEITRKTVKMVCGHYTDTAAQLFFSNSKPDGTRVYCETCEIWTYPEDAWKPKPLPDDPRMLF